MNTMTPAQQRAIDSKSPTILCLAGPGSGKSTTLAARIKRLISDGVNPIEIVAITFTNAGADALNKKLVCLRCQGRGKYILGGMHPVPEKEVECYCRGQAIRLGYSGTLHGFALRMLNQYGASIGYGERIALIDAEASADLIQSKAQSLGCKMPLDKLIALKAKGKPMLPITVPLAVIAGYFDELRENALCDFDTLLSEFARLVTWTNEMNDRFKYLFVDEVQDSAEIDWHIYYSLPIANKFFVGDSDQAIYSFRGGRVDCMMNFANRDDVELIALNENFRSHSEICAAANRLISHNKSRLEKDMVSVRGPGGAIHKLEPFMNEGEEISHIVRLLNLVDIVATNQSKQEKLNEVAILARTNVICAAFRDALKASGVPVVEPAKSTLPRDWALARSLVELLVNPDNDTLMFFYLIAQKTFRKTDPRIARAEAHELQRMARAAGKSINEYSYQLKTVALNAIGQTLHDHGLCYETIFKITEIIRALQPGSSLVDLALAMNVREPEPDTGAGVTVTTLHGFKGREADVVFIVGCEDETMPGNRKTDTLADVEEARRLFFVGVTRARRTLFLSHAQQRKTAWGTIASLTPSRFLKEI